MEQLLMAINEVETFLFDFNIKSFSDSIAKLTEELACLIGLLDEKKLNDLNSIVYYMNIALNNKDYLLYCDILEYELKPFIEQKCMD